MLLLWLPTVVLPTVLLLLLLLLLMLPAIASRSSISAATMLARLHGLSALQVDIYPACVLFCPVLQAQFPAQLFHLGLDLLDVAIGVVSLAHNGMQVFLASSLIGANTLLQYTLCFLNIEAVKVN